MLKTAEELDLRLNTDVRVQFTELLTNETLQDLAMPVKVSCHAVFSQFTIVPNHGLNFGPMVYNSERSRTFEVTNTGEFEFRYALYPEGEGPDADAEAAGGAPPAKDAKGGKGGGAAEGGTLTLGKFTVTPQSGVVEAGGAATLTVGFKAGADAEAFANRCPPFALLRPPFALLHFCTSARPHLLLTLHP